MEELEKVISWLVFLPSTIDCPHCLRDVFFPFVKLNIVFLSVLLVQNEKKKTVCMHAFGTLTPSFFL